MKARWQPRRRGGRPARKFDRAQVYALAFDGYDNAAVARQLGCDPRTLVRRCGRLLQQGRQAAAEQAAAFAKVPTEVAAFAVVPTMGQDWKNSSAG